MRFNFHETASMLYDFFMFPKLLYVNPDEIHKLNDVLGDDVASTFVDHESHRTFIKAAREDLEPYKDPLLGFYADDVLSNYDFPSLLFRSYSFLSYASYKDYVQAIMADDEIAIKKNLIYALIKVESSDDEISDAQARAEAEALCDNRDALLKLVRQTPTTENHRWILMLLIENPKEYLDVYVNLLNTIEPIFTRYYEEHRNKIERFKKDTIQPLQHDGVSAFASLTHGIIPSEVLHEENHVITSFVNPYRFGILTYGEDVVMVWGLDMNTGFKNIADFTQDTPKNRARIFKTLSDETRYDVLRHIARGVTSTKAIATALGVSSTTVTFHINAFLTAKIIKAVKSPEAKYVIDYDRLESFWQAFMNDLTSK